MGRSFFFPYLLSGRAPSETPMLARASSDGRASEFVHQDDKALIAARRYKWAGSIAIKFPYGGNIRNGCILMRHCLFAGASQTAIELRPVRRDWPQIRDRVRSGGPLFPLLAPNNFSR